MTLAELAERLGCRFDGDGSLEVTRVASIEDARPGDVTFLANPKYASKLPATRATAIIVRDDVGGAPCAMIRSANPYLTFAEAVAVLNPAEDPPPGVSPLASIDASAQIAEGVSVGPFAVIGAGARVGAGTVIEPQAVIGRRATIGADCRIHAQATVRDGVTVGARVVVQSGAVVGSDGYGFARREDGTHHKIPQVGGLTIEDDVEIGAGSTIDRPAVGETRIGAGTKIDNLVQIAHGVRVGRRVLLAGQVGIAGSTVVDDDVVMAGQSGAVGHVRIGRGAQVSATSAVTKDVPPGAVVAGVPARDVAAWREATALLARLPELRKALRDLSARLDALESRLDPKR